MLSRQLFKPLRRTNNFNPLSSTNRARLFSSTSAIMVKAGDSIPTVMLVEDSPGNLVDLHKELSGNGLIIGVPAAFSRFLSYPSLNFQN
jgi:peroxiredoxin 5